MITTNYEKLDERKPRRETRIGKTTWDSGALWEWHFITTLLRHLAPPVIGKRQCPLLVVWAITVVGIRRFTGPVVRQYMRA
jgi:hypothetical protein